MGVSKHKPSNSLSADWYTDDKFLKKEINQIFLKSWLLIGPEAQIANPGDCLFQSIVDQPIVCVRQEDNSIKTFFNICRHRAGSFENKKSKNNYLVCKYHGWTYSINGQLKSPRGFNKSEIVSEDLCLKYINTKIWKGLIFINFCDKPTSFGTTFNDVGRVLAPYKLENFVFEKKVSYRIKSNWKVYLDNFLEGLHIPIVHPKLNDVMNYRSYNTKLYKNFSVQSGKLDGSKSPYAQSSNNVAYYFTIYPNILFNIAPGRFQTNIIEPLDEKECVVHFDYFFDSVCEKEILRDINFSDEIQKEDILICEGVQKNLSSIGFEKGIISDKYEIGVKHFQDYIRNSTS